MPGERRPSARLTESRWPERGRCEPRGGPARSALPLSGGGMDGSGPATSRRARSNPSPRTAACRNRRAACRCGCPRRRPCWGSCGWSPNPSWSSSRMTCPRSPNWCCSNRSSPCSSSTTASRSTSWPSNQSPSCRRGGGGGVGDQRTPGEEARGQCAHGEHVAEADLHWVFPSSRVERQPIRAGTTHGAPRIWAQPQNAIGECEELPDERMNIHRICSRPSHSRRHCASQLT